ncbi:hypothetical protein GWI34_35885 [Actinomadura sp. DSM 109109]|nr:hypothetical protein [Actinomadura lepetitiana]
MPSAPPAPGPHPVPNGAPGSTSGGHPAPGGPPANQDRGLNGVDWDDPLFTRP